MDLSVSSVSESLEISLVLEWKILQSFPFLYCKTNIDWTSNFFNSLNNFSNLSLIVGFVLISCYSDLERYKAIRQLFLRFFSSHSSEYNYFLVDLKYSLKFMATKSFTSSSVKIFE